MKKSSNLNAEKERKKVRHWGWATIASLIGTMSAAGLYLKQQYEQTTQSLDINKLKHDMYNDLYNKYGCNTGQEFDSFVNANSNVIEEVITINGKDMVFTRTEYNEVAQNAMDEYWSLHDQIMDIINNFTPEPISINYEPIIAMLVIPTIITTIYLYHRHKYKKINNNIKEIAKMKENNTIEKNN